jgi:hypothetical protein
MFKFFIIMMTWFISMLIIMMVISIFFNNFVLRVLLATSAVLIVSVAAFVLGGKHNDLTLALEHFYNIFASSQLLRSRKLTTVTSISSTTAHHVSSQQYEADGRGKENCNPHLVATIPGNVVEANSSGQCPKAMRYIALNTITAIDNLVLEFKSDCSLTQVPIDDQ